MEVTRQQLGKEASVERRTYLCGLARPTTAQVAASARAHRGIENRLRWVLDVTFREDECRIRTGDAAENFALVRRIALDPIKAETSAKVGVATRRKMAGWDHGYLLEIMAGAVGTDDADQDGRLDAIALGSTLERAARCRSRGARKCAAKYLLI